MQTKNKKYLDEKANKEYYSESDGNFMPLDRSLFAHKYLPRVAWVREQVHSLGSISHIDVGCKDGYTCLTLQAEGIDCTGIDPSEDAIEEARHKALEAKLDCTFLVGFGEEIPDGIIADTVSCMEVIEHVVDIDKLLKVLSRIGRYVMITTPDAKGRHGMSDSERNEEHVRLFTKKELEDECGKYGEVIKCELIDDQVCILYKPK